jgi:hypothetical protein
MEENRYIIKTKMTGYGEEIESIITNSEFMKLLSHTRESKQSRTSRTKSITKFPPIAREITLTKIDINKLKDIIKKNKDIELIYIYVNNYNIEDKPILDKYYLTITKLGSLQDTVYYHQQDDTITAEKIRPVYSINNDNNQYHPSGNEIINENNENRLYYSNSRECLYLFTDKIQEYTLPENRNYLIEKYKENYGFTDEEANEFLKKLSLKYLHILALYILQSGFNIDI